MSPEIALQLEVSSEIIDTAINSEQNKVLALINPLVARGTLFFSEVSDQALEVAAEHPVAAQALKVASFISSKASEGEPNAFVVGAVVGAVVGLIVTPMVYEEQIKQEKNLLKKSGYIVAGMGIGAGVGAGMVGVNIVLSETVFSRE